MGLTAGAQTTSADVVIVGCGIAGGALATALAQMGRTVVALEAQPEYEDRVRGEKLFPWGVVEAERLGLVDALQGTARAHVSPGAQVFNGVDGAGSPALREFAAIVPGAYSLNFQHRLACEALAQEALAAGAEVVRDVADVEVALDQRRVSFTLDGDRNTIQTGLVVGADGRNSVVRRAMQESLHRRKADHYVAGMLVDGLPGSVMEFDVLAIDQGRFVLAFPQGEGRARVYVCPPASEKARYAGPTAAEHLLEDAAVPCLPFAEALRSATPIGPCKSYPGHDTWVDSPAIEGAVLVGDSAGYQSPITATGLSSALRDARMVAKAFAEDGSLDFDEYAAERTERCRRLRFVASLLEVLSTGPGAAERTKTAGQRAASAPELGRWRAAQFFGPEVPPPEALSAAVFEQLTAPG